MNTARQNKLLLVAILSTIIAIGIHFYLSTHFYQLKVGMSEASSLCNLSEVFNCDAVATSEYASFLGVPIALWGAITNLILLFFLTISRWSLTQDREKTLRYTFMLSTVVLMASVVMGSIASTMANICLFCVATYALSLITFVMVLLTVRPDLPKIPTDIRDIFTSERWVAGFIIAIPALTFITNFMYLESHGYSQMQKTILERVAYWKASPTQNFDLTKGLVLKRGDSPVKMTIVEFADFRCGHCKTAAPTLHAFTEARSDVQLVMKPFPLDGTCNEAMQGGGDGISCGLAHATMCAEKLHQQGWAAHDFIFEKQYEIIQSRNLQKSVEELAQHLKVDLDELQACMKSDEITGLVRDMAKEGANANIRGTPTIFVNGKLLNGGQVLPVLIETYKSIQ